MDYCPWWIPCLLLWRRMLFSHWKSCQCYQPCHSPDTGPYVHPFQGPQPRLCPIQTKCPVGTVFWWWWKCCAEEIPKDDCYLLWMPLRSLLTRYKLDTQQGTVIWTQHFNPIQKFLGYTKKNHHSLFSPPVFWCIICFAWCTVPYHGNNPMTRQYEVLVDLGLILRLGRGGCL